MACPSAAKVTLRHKSGPSPALNVVGSQASIATICDPADTICGMPAHKASGPMLQPDKNDFLMHRWVYSVCARPYRRMFISQSLPFGGR
jgi:hypothetical protein